MFLYLHLLSYESPAFHIQFSSKGILCSMHYCNLSRECISVNKSDRAPKL